MELINRKLLTILDEAIELVSIPNNVFLYCSWYDANDAIRELRSYQSEIAQGDFRHLSQLRTIFSPTGPLQELSIDSGWGSRYLDLANRFDAVLNDL